MSDQNDVQVPVDHEMIPNRFVSGLTGDFWLIVPQNKLNEEKQNWKQFQFRSLAWYSVDWACRNQYLEFEQEGHVDTKYPPPPFFIFFDFLQTRKKRY